MPIKIKLIDLINSYEDVFMVYTSDSIGKIVMICEDAFKFTGYSIDFLMKKGTFESAIHPNDLTEYLNFCNNYDQSQSIQIKFRLRAASGNYIEVCEKKIKLDLAKKQQSILLHIFFKETKKNYLEKEDGLISYHRYQNLVDSINDVIFQTDNNGNWVFLNNSWKQIMGYEISEAIGVPFFNYIHPDDVQQNFELFKPLIEGKKRYCNHEIRYISKAGKIIWMNVYAILLRDNLGNIIGTSGTLRDVTQDVANRDMVKLLSDNISDLISVHGLDGTFKYVSPSFSTLTDYAPEDLIGKSPFDFFHPDDVKKVQLSHKFLLKSPIGASNCVDYRFRLKSCQYIWFESNSRITEGKNGDRENIISSTRGVNERKKAEEQLLKSLTRERELNQLKSSFVNLASHEFRTPLACIRSSAELLDILTSKTNVNAAKIARHTSNIFEEVDRLSELMDEVLTVGKIESDKFSCKKEPVLISKLVYNKVNSVGTVQEDGRSIKVKLLNEKSMIMIDPLLIGYVLTNLISNAFKYSKGKKSPEIHLDFNTKDCVIKIKDFGIGIPFDEQDKIFQAFYRAENVHNIKGTGLGMFITKKFIELHGGTISFTSIPEKGTEFTLIIPQR